MRKASFQIIIAILLLGCRKASVYTTYQQPPEDSIRAIAAQIVNANWTSKKLSEEVVWKYHHFENLFSSKQSVTVIDVDLNEKTVRVEIPYVTSGFITTSATGEEVGAIAAINGSYFNTKKGGSTVFFKKAGNVINYTVDGFDYFREEAGFVISLSGEVDIIRKPSHGWEYADAHTLLVSGPLLVFNSEPVDLLDHAFNTTRHPRTAVGITADNHLVAVVVDGRDPQAAGMTSKQLALMMDVMGCEEAMNLDGGGSSTAWVRGHGVVNYPTDNDKFDHDGERAVANVICFIEQTQ